LRKLEVNTATSQLLVHLRVSIESVIHTTLLLLIEHHLQDLASILLGPQSLADDLNGEDEVGEDRVVDSGQCSGTGTLLGERGARAVGALGAGEDAARGEDQDVAVGELLFELTGESALISTRFPIASCTRSVWMNKKGAGIPLLHTVETLQGRNGDKDDNSLLAVADFNLYNDQKSACELQVLLNLIEEETMDRNPSVRISSKLGICM
jgi:hypothetical protein